MHVLFKDDIEVLSFDLHRSYGKILDDSFHRLRNKKHNHDENWISEDRCESVKFPKLGFFKKSNEFEIKDIMF